MWWRIAGVWLTVPALLAAATFLGPVEKHTVKLDMPQGMTQTQMEQAAEASIWTGMIVAGLLAIVVLVVIPALLTRRIIRKHRTAAALSPGQSK